MSKSSNEHPTEKFYFPNSKTLWHDRELNTPSLGCQQCQYLKICGGLNVGSGIFDCLTFCKCKDPLTCDNVCPRNMEHFVARTREIQGFDLNNVPHALPLVDLNLPNMVPMIYHNSARSKAPTVSAVAVSLYQLINKVDGSPRFQTRQDLLNHFILDNETNIILSGTDIDRLLERWWQLADTDSLVQKFRSLGVNLITTPNFSLFDDVPRHDNMFNMKRIAKIWSEIQRQGIHCALHINARTEHDWERWIKFLNLYPEIYYIAFEFGTGAGTKGRIDWHVSRLEELAHGISRPLHLIVRGGLNEINKLGKAFSGVTVIETNAFIKAQKRRKAVLKNGKIEWIQSLTLQNEPIDGLLDANISALKEYLDFLLYKEKAIVNEIQGLT